MISYEVFHMKNKTIQSQPEFKNEVLNILNLFRKLLVRGNVQLMEINIYNINKTEN